MAFKRKRKFAKRRKFGHKKKKFNKSVLSGRKAVMVNRTPARMHNVIAPRYYTRLESGFQGALANSGVAGVTSQFFTVSGDTPVLPWNTVDSFTDMAGASLINGAPALNVLQPIGVARLGNLYSRSRQWASKITVTMMPTTADNYQNYNLIIYPISSFTGLTWDAPVADPIQAMAMPYAKCITVSPYNNVKQNTLSSYMDSPTINGLTRQQYKDENTAYGSGGAPSATGQFTSLLPSTVDAQNGTPPNFGWFWVIIYSAFSPDAGGFTNDFGISAKVTMWEECLAPIQALGDLDS